MPHGESWFNYILPYERISKNLQEIKSLGGWHPPAWLSPYWFQDPANVQHVIGALFVLALIVFFAVMLRRRVSDFQNAVIPEGKLTFSSFVEVFVEAIYGLMRQNMTSEQARFFLPLIGTTAIFIFLSNAMGLVPGFLPPTQALNTTLACAMVIFFATHIYGVKAHGFGPYFAHFLGPIRKWYAIPLMVLMVAVESISHIFRPITLGARLMANMTADHAAVEAFFDMVKGGAPVVPLVLGSVVVIVQTLVFSLLSIIYIQMAVAHEEH